MLKNLLISMFTGHGSIFNRAVAHLYYKLLPELMMQLNPRDWQLDFGPVYGEAGTTTTLVVSPQCWYRGEKIMARDTSVKGAGLGTRISAILIGQKLQRPAGSGATLSVFFANNALGNGIKWDICPPNLSIAVTVSFVESCTFDMIAFGKAVL